MVQLIFQSRIVPCRGTFHVDNSDPDSRAAYRAFTADFIIALISYSLNMKPNELSDPRRETESDGRSTLHESDKVSPLGGYAFVLVLANSKALDFRFERGPGNPELGSRA